MAINFDSFKTYPVQQPTVTKPVEIQPTQAKTDTKTTENIGMSTAVKVGLGAAAVAAMVVGGIFLRNKINKINLVKDMNKVKNNLQNLMKRNENPGNDLFDNKILQRHIDDVLKLPKTEQLKKLQEMEQILSADRKLVLRLKRHPEMYSTLPEEVKSAIAS